jgi:cation transport regulator ChaB
MTPEEDIYSEEGHQVAISAMEDQYQEADDGRIDSLVK